METRAVVFTLNGKSCTLNSKDVPVNTSLNSFIRNHAELRGTKFMCLEGGCGACTVAISGVHPATNEFKTWSANSCLIPVYSCHGLAVTTVEGITGTNYHDVQSRLGVFNGIQCGFCSPGMVMNMYGLLEANKGIVSQEVVETSFGGNVCRCTGYRPILDGFKSLATDADPQIQALCRDIEDIKLCSGENSRKNGKCKGNIDCASKRKTQIKIEFSDTTEWHRALNLDYLFTTFAAIGNRPYMLVGGNTGHGIYRRNPNLEIFIDVTRIPVLRQTTIGTVIELGGNVTITEMIELFESASTNANFRYLTEIVGHLKEVASYQLRNIATIAGNLALKHQYPDFASDLFLIFSVIEATLTINGPTSATQSIVVSPATFLTTDMTKKIITKITIPPYNDVYVFRSYKIKQRAQNTIGYIKAAFLFSFNNDKSSVLTARIGYAGINNSLTRATTTEAFVIGKNIFTNDIFRSVLLTLQGEVVAVAAPPNASPEYRNTVALSLFYKFVLSISPSGSVEARNQSGATVLSRGLSSGQQSFETQEERYPLSKIMHRIDAFVQAGGETPFSNDVPKQPNELWAGIVQAYKVHGKIIGFDAAAALQISGVKHFFSASDIPGENNFSPGGQIEEIFCSGRVLYGGQSAGMILANTLDIANYAASLVKINYETETISEPVLPTMQSVFDAVADSRITTGNYRKQATDEGTNNQYKVEGRFEMGPQYHFSMETQTCVALPAEDGLTLFPSTQWMTFLTSSVANALGIPLNRLNVECRRIGGGFGSKLTRANFAGCIAALGCHLTGVTVRYVMTLESNMEILGKRNNSIADYVVDVDNAGKIQKLVHKIYSDNGSSPNDAVDYGIGPFFQNCYDWNRWEISSSLVATDAPSHTAMRAPGTLDGIAMIESIMEHIAHEIGEDSVDVRLQNMPTDHDIIPRWNEFMTSVEYRTRKADIENFNSANRWKKRGIAVIPMEYRHNYGGNYHALVTIHSFDGTVSISHGGIEMGQGINTKVCQVAAYTLGIPIFNVAIKPTISFLGPNAEASGGSWTSDTVSMAVMRACEALKSRIQVVRDQYPTRTWAEITKICNDRNIKLTEYYSQTPDLMPGHTVLGFTCAEIEVDILTGNYILRRVDLSEDVGESYSPQADVGQVEGAFVMGMGLWLTEKIIYDSNGKLLTNRAWNYLPPGPNDIPVDFRITFWKNSTNEKSVLRSKVTGEPPICMSVVVLFALRNALYDARKDAGLQYGGMKDFKAPYTVENIFLTTGTDPVSFTL